jgi:hypothetical protein
LLAVNSPDDANDLRGLHFRQLMRKPLTLCLLPGWTILAGVVGVSVAGLGIGLLVALVALATGVGVVFWVADSRAADAFFEVYARQRGLVEGGRSDLPGVTPLLRKGDTRYAERTLNGSLAGGVDGTLALYTYTETTYDGENTRTSYYHYTLGLIEVPECVARVPELYCQRKSGLRALEKFEDAFRGSKERVKLESEALDKRYEIFAREGQDAEWLRQLFAPSFIVWLTDSAPEKFAFELVGGTLCCYVKGHEESAAGLDTIAAASAAVATRLREESLE